MILAATAESTGGICMPCKHKAVQAAREAYIRENRKVIDPFAGVTDRVEIIKIHHRPRKPDPLIAYLPHPAPLAELYEQLTATEVSQLIRHVLANHTPEADDAALEIAKELAAFTDADLSQIQEALLAAEEYYPAHLFRGASPRIARSLIARLGRRGEGETSPGRFNLMLQAMAWAGTDEVACAFAGWRAHSPEWRAQLYIPPENYAHCAGWELDAAGGARKLFLHKCYPLLARTDGMAVGPVSTALELPEACQWCGRPLTALFAFDLDDQRLACIPFRGRRLTIATCLLCTAFCDRLYMRAGPDGETRWHAGSRIPDNLPKDGNGWQTLPANRLGISDKARLPHHAVDWCLPTTFSQVGGLPSWIQEPAYRRCPECRKAFVFVAQLAVEDVDAWGEGIYYALMCPDCSITSVCCQQT
jgi:hypothetical protein